MKGNMLTVAPTAIYRVSRVPASAVGAGNLQMNALPVMRALSVAYDSGTIQ